MWPLSESEKRLHTLYPDIPPESLLNLHLGINISADDEELKRARWFWGRQPNKLILSRDRALRTAVFYLTLWIASTFIQEQPQLTQFARGVAWISLAALAVLVFVDISRYARWKWEYYCAVSRLFATLTR